MTLEDTVALDKKYHAAATSYLLVLAILANQSLLQSPFLGFALSFIYILINGISLGNVLVEHQELLIRLILGGFLFTMLLSFVGWLVSKVYKLDLIGVTLVLLVCTTATSLLNRMMKYRND